MAGSDEYNSALDHSPNSVCRQSPRESLRAAVACRPWSGWDNNPPSWLVAVFYLNCKNMCGAKAPLCSGEKKTIIYYSNEMRSGRWWERGWGLVAENLLLPTSVISVSPWRNKKFKGNQQSWRISLAYFQWATLEADVQGVGMDLCRN